jgi:hypothetical protein
MKRETSIPSVRASQQSAAEFFSEHQQIAGFDNPGKSLYTSIREFVENSLDAAESINSFPEVEVTVIEYTEEEHNSRHGIDVGLARRHSGSAAKDKGGKDATSTTSTAVADAEAKPSSSAAPGAGGSSSKVGESAGGGKEKFYYDVICRDNGCGIASDQVGAMLGRVLSGTKQGIKQTRGKFGLGAKMVRYPYYYNIIVIHISCLEGCGALE